MASLADAFLSQFPQGTNPLVDAAKFFTQMQQRHSEQEKQNKTQQPQNLPQGVNQGLFGLQPGNQLPPVVGNQQNPGNIAGRALGGMGADIKSIISGGASQALQQNPSSALAQLPGAIRNALNNPDVREFIGSATGKPPDSFIPINIDKQADAKEVGAEPEDVDTVPPQEEEGEPSKAKSKFFNFLKSLGIPLIVTGIGVAFPGALAGAAGFNKGYVDQILENADDEDDAVEKLTKLVELDNAITEGKIKKEELGKGEKRKSLSKEEFKFIKADFLAPPEDKAIIEQIKDNIRASAGKPPSLTIEESRAWDRANPKQKAQILNFLKTGN